MGVVINPNSKCSNCRNYVDMHCAQNSVPKFCGKRYDPIKKKA